MQVTVFSKSEGKLMCGIHPIISLARVVNRGKLTSRVKTAEKALALASIVKQFYKL